MLAALTAVTFVLAAAPRGDAEVPPEARKLIEQPLAGFEDECEEKDGFQVRHIRFGTVNATGRTEDRIEVRTTTWPGPVRALDYLVNDTVMFSQTSGEDLRPTPAGIELLRAADGRRAVKVLAAFAAAHPRIFAADVETPHDSCGATAGKAEETAKCGAIGVAGCASLNPFVCGVSAGLAVLCKYLVDKVCEETPESCEPGWTEG